ncbi:PadR family transcriptional regulator [Nonomuraea spiralis]|uniref:PadR family transcriptional regulator n=1 Tax=Nonomuraea spiralis TaxID=46182 RepID=A0ABV5IBK4_9ACTN|nr:PadR family transcriptional regulator [Nonomuraea spiralis]GGT05846.1 transcriptional regulator [Nonomuraea spiralis]
MALRYALLGLLSEGPASGYDLAKAFEGELGSHAWQAGYNRIYPELARLTEEGLIEPAGEGVRGRRAYGVTEAGRAELRAWLLAPRKGGAVRNEPVLRLFLLSALDPEDARTVLREIAANSERQLAELGPAMAVDTPVSPGGRLPFGWLAAGYGLRQYRAAHDWATWALGELDKLGEPDKPGRRHPEADS